MKTYQTGIIGCGDFLRLNADSIKNSSRIKIRSLYDPDTSRMQTFAGKLQGCAVESAETILQDDSIDLVMIFVPPWARRPLIEQAAACGKHIITTKPLAPSIADCEAILNAANGRVKCGVMYRRTGNAEIEQYRHLFNSGEIGRLSIYKQDWLHHYPQWNTWALEPKKNGGPFMDAMIHNLNIARYLMNAKVRSLFYTSENHVQQLACRDTEFMKINFSQGGTAYLFITWAADLTVFSLAGNDRKHIDHFYMITDQGWHVEPAKRNNIPVIVAQREDQERVYEIKPLSTTPFDSFAAYLADETDMPSDMASLQEAFDDIWLIRTAEQQPSRVFFTSE